MESQPSSSSPPLPSISSGRIWRVIVLVVVSVALYLALTSQSSHSRVHHKSDHQDNSHTTTDVIESLSPSNLARLREFLSRPSSCVTKPLTFATEKAPALTAESSATLLPSQYRWYPGMKEKHRRYAAVIVESRPVDRLVRVILQFMSVLDEDWEFQVYHSPRNERMLRDSSSLQWAMAQGRLKLYHIDRDQFDQNWYNSLFMNNRTFWEHISSELILIFQVDAVLCNRSPTTIKDYLQFDYIGGAWGGAHSFGGNGGLSLRRRAKVLECVSPYAGGQMEDTHFAFCMNARGHRVARQADSIPFSVETVFYGTPWGIHNAWMYLGEPQIAALRAYCPEVEDPIWFQYNEK